jgi:hypothetical protein
MNSVTTIASIGSIAAGAVVAVGVGLIGTVISTWISARRSLRTFRLDTLLELADTAAQYLDFSDEGWRAMTKALERLDVRLQVSDVPAGLRSAFRQIEQACWSDCAAAVEIHDQPGVDAEKLKADKEVREVIGMYLTRQGSTKSRGNRMATAIEQVKSVDPPPTQAEQDSGIFL